MVARQPSLAGEMDLDAARPLIDVMLAGQSVRLRLDPAQWGAIELNPAVAARLALTWAPGRNLSVGRTTLLGRTAPAEMAVAGTRRLVLVATHDRTAAANAEGVIGPDLLPYASIRWRRVDAPSPTGTVVLPLTLDEARGLEAAAPDLAPGLFVRFSLTAPETTATAAAAALLVRRLGGQWDGPVVQMPLILGVTRPVRPIRFGRPFRVAGFRVDRLGIRVADFRGDNPLPSETLGEADITVSRRERPQGAEPWVSLGLDRLGSCTDITYRAAPRTLTLSCAFDP